MVARRRRLSAPALAIVLAGTLAVAAPAAEAATCPGADQPVASSIDGSRAATLCLINNERGMRGVRPLTSQPLLDAAATSYSQAMVAQRFFDHVSPTGETLERRLASYVSAGASWEIGENIAWGEGPYATPAAIVDSWMQSAEHRENILEASFAEIGIGIAVGSPVGSPPSYSATYTTDFGSRTAPLGAAPAPRPPAPPAADSSAQSASDPGTARPRPPARKVSAAKKRRITAQCKRIARRTRSSRAARKRRVERCVRARLRAAVRGG